MVSENDASGDGELDMVEFTDFMLTEPWASKLKLQGQMKEFRQLFNLLDTEGNPNPNPNPRQLFNLLDTEGVYHLTVECTCVDIQCRRR